MEIRILGRNPIKESRDFGVGAQRAERPADPLQFGIGKAGVKDAVADRVNRLPFASAAALRHRVMPFDPRAQRAGAEPTGFWASFHFGNRAGFRIPANRR